MRQVLLLLVLALLIAGCGDDEKKVSGDETETVVETTEGTETTASGGDGCTEVSQPAAKEDGGAKKPSKKLDGPVAVTFKTNCGDFTVDVNPKAGLTAASFVALAKDGFYDDTFFHRIAPAFVIQGGDPTGSGTGGPGYTTEDAPASDAVYTKGTVAMAKGGAEPAGTAGSQFFVVTDDAGGGNLTPDYAIVGEISDGLDVVEAIGRLGDVSEQPTQVVAIEKASVEE